MDVGFVGLGAMGSAMVPNLIKAGHTVRVWNRSPEPAQAMADVGATPVASVEQALRGEAVITMLANDDAVRDVYLTGVLARAPKHLAHVNCSTISVALAKALTEAHAALGLGYVAAPVFGRPNTAAAAQLNIVAAGAPEVLAKVQSLFDAMGQKTWPVGAEPFRANVVKIGGNLMIAAAIEAMSEVATLGQAHGIEPAEMLAVYTNTMFASPAYKSYSAQIIERRYEPAGFKLKLGLKDVRLALQAGDDANVALPFGSALRDALLTAMADGDGEKDWCALAEVARKRSGLT